MNKLLPDNLGSWISWADFNEIIPYIHDHKEIFLAAEENLEFIDLLGSAIESSQHRDILKPWFHQWICPEIFNVGLALNQRFVLQENVHQLARLLSCPRTFSRSASTIDFKVEDLLRFALDNNRSKSVELMLQYGVYTHLEKYEIEALGFYVRPLVAKYYSKRKVEYDMLPAVIQAAAAIGNISSVEAFILEYPDWTEFSGSIGYNLVDLSLLAESWEMVDFLKLHGGYESTQYKERYHSKTKEYTSVSQSPSREEPDRSEETQTPVTAGPLPSQPDWVVPTEELITPETESEELGAKEVLKETEPDSVQPSDSQVKNSREDVPSEEENIFGDEGISGEEVPSEEESIFGDGGIFTPRATLESVPCTPTAFDQALEDMPISREAKELISAWRNEEFSEDELAERFGTVLMERSRLLFDILNEYFKE